MGLAISSVHGGISLSKPAVVCCVVCVSCQFCTCISWFIDPSLMFAALQCILKQLYRRMAEAVLLCAVVSCTRIENSGYKTASKLVQSCMCSTVIFYLVPVISYRVSIVCNCIPVTPTEEWRQKSMVAILQKRLQITSKSTMQQWSWL